MQIPKWVSPQEQVCNLGNQTWSVARLFELSKDLPVQEVPLDYICVSSIYEKLNLREMVMHMQAVLDADLSKPIILSEDGDIMDGRHRIMKAMLNNYTEIKVVRFDENPTPCRES